MRELTVDLEKNAYQIRVGSGVLSHLSDELKDLCQNRSVAIITDDNVFPLYGDAVEKELKKCADSVHLLSVPAGEASKSPEMLVSLMRKLLNLGMNRSGILVALGGGVIGDLTGFLASVFLRGIPYIGIPTTLLAQVDSSVGGKTAVNLPEGKNLMGTFYQPARVIIDPDCLQTLDEREFACGMAEVIKYGAIRDRSLFDQLKTCDDFSQIAEDVIADCCRMKAEIVVHDERDTGERMLLNFGHTVGHAVEHDSGYGTLSHGAAVAIGMCVIAKYGEAFGYTKTGAAKEIAALCEKYHLPTTYPCSEDLLHAVLYDKKNASQNINLVLVKEIGDAFLKAEDCKTFLSDLQRIW